MFMPLAATIPADVRAMALTVGYIIGIAPIVIGEVASSHHPRRHALEILMRDPQPGVEHGGSQPPAGDAERLPSLGSANNRINLNQLEAERAGTP